MTATAEKPKIIAWMKPSCGWSQGVRAVLKKYDLSYEDRDIINNPSFYEEMVEKTGQMKQPSLEINGRVLADVSGEELETWMLQNGIVTPNSAEPEAPINQPAPTNFPGARRNPAASVSAGDMTRVPVTGPGRSRPGSVPGLLIRPATADDTPVIVRFIHALAEYERLTHECVATAEGIRATLFGGHPAAEVVLGELDGTPVGFALFFPNYSTFLARPGLYLEDLFVLPDYRGRGFGKALLLHVGRLACERGCGRFDWAVLDWNEPSIRFYRALGATPLADWTVMRVTGDALAQMGTRAQTGMVPKAPSAGRNESVDRR